MCTNWQVSVFHMMFHVTQHKALTIGVVFIKTVRNIYDDVNHVISHNYTYMTCYSVALVTNRVACKILATLI